MNFTVRVVETSSNKRGDLFGRLMSDLFVSLGYDEIRLNVHKAGREIDLEGRHRFEDKHVFVECKAEKEPAGGDIVNKFVGALDAERRRHDGETIGYLISLGGFRQTAIQQEKELGERRVILMTGEDAARELVRGRLLIAPEIAIGTARASAERIDPTLSYLAQDLLATRFGWTWLLRFGSTGICTHYILIHADGNPISAAIAREILEEDHSLRRDLGRAIYIDDGRDARADIDSTRDHYFQYLKDQCGEIPLAGLPADQEVGSRRLRMERIFVPLHLSPVARAEEKLKEQRLSLGKVLKKHSRLAVLGAPGVGKSTLLKRIAVAYSDRSRRKEVADDLPERKWFPLLIRCRQLGSLSRSPIEQILSSIPERAEMRMEKRAFDVLLQEALHGGAALLLIDGLDEIVDEGDRVAFVDQLHTFLWRYPSASMILTSREAGFRVVAGSLPSHCQHFTVSSFDAEDVRRLTVAWHLEVVGKRKEIREEAHRLATAITQSDRVMRLAENPLLLTTLLLVRRWVGQLPTRRSVLYAKAVEVLLMTWNVEAHKPLDPEEIVPQLAYVAYSMLDSGRQRISQRKLLALLSAARNDMPEVLAYARMSAADVVKSVEYRSSLLVHAGYTVDDGALVPLYEFRHLTFQEYLAAKAVAEGHYPARGNEESLVHILGERIDDPQWIEVIPLAAVMAGRRADPLIEHLTAEGNWSLLVHCLSDEVQVSPATATSALRALARQSLERGEVLRLYDSKFGETFREILIDEVMNGSGKVGEIVANLCEIEIQLFEKQASGGFHDLIEQYMNSHSDRDRVSGALLIQYVLSLGHRGDLGETDAYIRRLAPMMEATSHGLQYIATLTTAMLAERGLVQPDQVEPLLARAASVMRRSDTDLLRAAAWVIARLPILDRARGRKILAGTNISIPDGPEIFYDHARLVVGYYLDPLSDVRRELRSRLVGGRPDNWWLEHFYRVIT